MDINLASLAARSDLGPLNLLQQTSSFAWITGSSGLPPVALTARWNLATAAPVSEAGNVYTLNLKPFDFTGTTFPLVVLPTFIANPAAVRSICVSAAVISQSQVDLRLTVSNTAAATTLLAGESLQVLIIGRRTDIPANPLSTLLTKRGNLGVTGM